MRNDATRNKPEPTTDHDALFKQLLLTFFVEFVLAFLPDVAAQIDFDTLAFQPQELLTDLGGSERHIVDMLVKVKRRGEEVFLLIHIENQSRTEADFAFRMSKYAALLHIKYRLPVYSVVIFSHDAPVRPETSRYVMSLFGKKRLWFDYTVIQLNRLSWRRFIQTPNPAAAALMTKMKIAPKDRLKVTREIVRMIATLRLDPARTHLIANFMDAYLRLTAGEMQQYERRYNAEETPEERKTMELLPNTFNMGKQAGIKETMELLPHTRYAGKMEGLQEGAEKIVLRQIRKRFGAVRKQETERLDGLSADQLADLGEALLDFTSPADLEAWLERQ